MLEFFRQHIGGMFGIVIVGVLALAFALSFGAQSAGWGKAQSEQYAASVDGIDIPESTLKYAFNLMGGRRTDQTDAQRSSLQISVLRGLIERQLVLNAAEKLGISASTDEAEERIVKNELYLTQSLSVISKELERNVFVDPTFMSRIMVSDGHRVRQTFEGQDEKFDLELYKKFVRYHLQLTEEAFVEQQRLEIIAERMRQMMMGSVRISQDEIRSAYEREHNTATIDYIRFIPSYFTNRLSPTKEELKAWADAHPDEINAYYETNRFKYTNIEKMVRARHILIKVDEGASEVDKAAAKQKITTLLARARAGADFAELARENSEDEASAVKGGDLGFNPRGRMVPEFDEAMFTAEPGKVTDVVETKYGFHIIKVEEAREGNVSIEDATPEIAEALYTEIEGEKLAKTTADSFLERLKAGETMSSLVEEKEDDEQPYLGLKVLTSRPFSISSNSVPGIGEAPEIVAAAFSLTNDTSLAEKIFEIRNDYYIIQLNERKTPSDKEFENLKEGIAAKLLSIKQGSWLRDQLVAMTERAEKEGRIQVLVSQATTAPTSSRTTQEEDEPPQETKTDAKSQRSTGKAEAESEMPEDDEEAEEE